MRNPCYNPETGEDCPRRKPGCGARCKEWAAYTHKRNTVYKKRQEVSESAGYAADRARRMSRYQKKKRKEPRRWDD